MPQKFDLSASGPQKPTEVICLSCGASNPPKAYCCLTCFKVLRAKVKPPLWQMAMRPSVSLIVFFLIVFIASMVAMKRWIDNIEARFTMDVKTAESNISVVADKRRRSGLIAPSVNPFEQIEAEESGHALPPAEEPAPAAPAQP